MKPEYVVSYAWKGDGVITKSKIYYRPDRQVGEYFQACDSSGEVVPKTSGYVVDIYYTSESDSDIRVALAFPGDNDERAVMYFTRHTEQMNAKLLAEAEALREKACKIRKQAQKRLK